MNYKETNQKIKKKMWMLNKVFEWKTKFSMFIIQIPFYDL